MTALFSAMTLDQIHSTYLIFAILGGLVIAGLALKAIGLVGWGGEAVARVIRGTIRTGFRLWERYLSWAGWYTLVVLAGGIIAASLWFIGSGVAWIAIPIAALLIVAGAVTCFAYMHISFERYEVGRGFKALHDPGKGQELAVDLLRYGPQLGVPMLGSAAGVTLFAFALLNQALYESGGQSWYRLSDSEAHPGYLDFLAYTIVNLLRAVDIFDLAKSYEFLSVSLIRPTGMPSSLLLKAFKSFFTVVLLQQVFASLRQNMLLAETVTDFWSPHLPVRERARSVLPQFGPGAVIPILVALRSAANLTKEQREQLPVVLAGIGPTAIPGLMRHLHDRHETTRVVTSAALGLLKVREAVPHLAGLVGDSVESVRLNAVEALGRIGEAHAPRNGRARAAIAAAQPRWWRRTARWIRHPRFKLKTAISGDEVVLAVVLLGGALKDSSAAVRGRAAAATGRIGLAASAVSTTLLELLRTDVDDVRVQAATALGLIRTDDPGAISALAEALADPNAEVRGAAAQALGEYRESARGAVPTLVGLLQDGNEDVRAIAAAAIAKIGVSGEDSTRLLVDGLSSADNVVRAQTAESLGRIGAAAETAAPALAEALNDPNDRVRAKAAEALGRIGESAASTAVPALMRLLRDEDNWVRALAAEALGEMGESADEAGPALLRSLRHANPHVRGNAAESLGKLRSESARPHLEAACSDPDTSVRTKAVRSVGTLGSLADSSKRVLLTAVEDAAPEVRATAADSLAEWAPEWPDSIDSVLVLVGDGNSDVAEHALGALQKFAVYTDAALEAVLARLRDANDSWIQSVAAMTLGRMGASAAGAGADLASVALTGDVELRQAAMRALAILQPPEAADAFLAGLRDAEADVRKIASAGLQKGGVVPEGGVDAVIDALRDPDIRVRTTIASVLARLDPVPPASIAGLIECAAPGNEESLRMAAAIALRAAGSSVPARVMIDLLKDSNQKVRLVAVSAVIATDPANADAADVIREAMADPNPRLRESALSLIENSGEAVSLFRKDLEAARLGDSDPGIVERIDRQLGAMTDEINPEGGSESAHASSPEAGSPMRIL